VKERSSKGSSIRAMASIALLNLDARPASKVGLFFSSGHRIKLKSPRIRWLPPKLETSRTSSDRKASVLADWA